MNAGAGIRPPLQISGRCPDVAAATEREGQDMHKHTAHHPRHGAAIAIETDAALGRGNDAGSGALDHGHRGGRMGRRNERLGYVTCGVALPSNISIGPKARSQTNAYSSDNDRLLPSPFLWGLVVITVIDSALEARHAGPLGNVRASTASS